MALRADRYLIVNQESGCYATLSNPGAQIIIAPYANTINQEVCFPPFQVYCK